MRTKKFPYRILAEWSDADECFVARVPAFPNLAAHGDTMGEAVDEAQGAAEAFLQVLGDKAPEPDNVAPSGNIRLRLPPSLHAALSRLATVEAVSLNHLMVTLLAERSMAHRLHLDAKGGRAPRGAQEVKVESAPAQAHDSHARKAPMGRSTRVARPKPQPRKSASS